MTEKKTVRTMHAPRAEYPRPQFVRETWMTLNGDWEFDFDDDDHGLREQWYKKHEFTRTIHVPFAFQSQLSKVDVQDFHDVVWYRRTFTQMPDFADKRLYLHFGAVDYAASVWINGQLAITHEGGHTPFSADITDLLEVGTNTVVVRATDSSHALDQPRGKQYWQVQSANIFYTRTTGIWQSVWLESVPEMHIGSARFTGDIDRNAVTIAVALQGYDPQCAPDKDLAIEIRFKGALVAYDRIRVLGSEIRREIELGDRSTSTGDRLWSPEHPHLYDVSFTLWDGDAVIDRVASYFGMRKIETRDGRVYLNNHPYYMRLVLDQGYFAQGILTAPTDDAIRQDVELTKAMGFNGARKHQKVEDPRYLYWCDQLGLLVWGEMANSYVYTDRAVERITREWLDVLRRDYSHPCIVAWVPVNESWGVPHLLSSERERAHLQAMYHLTKSLDDTRLVVSNDGWEHAVSDLCTIHDYDSRKDVLKDRYATVEGAVRSMPAGRLIYAPGFSHRGEPVLLTEFGGISFKRSEWDGWGYSGATSEKDFIERYQAVVQALIESPAVQGFCYTQLTDVEQEINGLLTYDRKPKVNVDIIRAITQGRPIPEE